MFFQMDYWIIYNNKPSFAQRKPCCRGVRRHSLVCPPVVHLLYFCEHDAKLRWKLWEGETQRHMIYGMDGSVARERFPWLQLCPFLRINWVMWELQLLCGTVHILHWTTARCETSTSAHLGSSLWLRKMDVDVNVVNEVLDLVITDQWKPSRFWVNYITGRDWMLYIP